MAHSGPYGDRERADTTFTKVFVGGLAWETQRDTMRQYFAQFGEILEAVVIADRETGRSKGYGFVTFKEPEAARRACLDPTPIIDGRRANCNLASLGQKQRQGGKGPGGGHHGQQQQHPHQPHHQQQHHQQQQQHGAAAGYGAAFPSASPAAPFGAYPHAAYPLAPYGFAPQYGDSYAYAQSMYGAYGGGPFPGSPNIYGATPGMAAGMYGAFPGYVPSSLPGSPNFGAAPQAFAPPNVAVPSMYAPNQAQQAAQQQQQQFGGHLGQGGDAQGEGGG